MISRKAVKMLDFVIPKGSLEAVTLKLLEEADLKVKRGSDREYNASIDDPRIGNVRVLRPQEIPIYVQEGYFDIGITGSDWVLEREADVVELSELVIAKGGPGSSVKLVLAVDGKSTVNSASDIRDGARISTEYPGIVENYFKKIGKRVNIYLSYGATEAKVPDLADAIVELTETGSTLRKHGLRIIDTVLESSTRLIANKQSFENEEKRSDMMDIKILLEGSLNAKGKVLLKFNIKEKMLEGIVDRLPSMKAPTVSKLHKDDYMAVETVVEKKGINLLIPELIAGGAEDLLELPIIKII